MSRPEGAGTRLAFFLALAVATATHAGEGPGTPPEGPADDPGRIELKVEAGRARWFPGGTGSGREAPAALVLYPGDHLELEPASSASAVRARAPSQRLEGPGRFQVGPDGLVPTASSRPGAPAGGTLFATLRPIMGAVHVRQPGLEAWTEERGVVSLVPGTRVRTGPLTRAEISAAGDFVLRLERGSEVAVGPRRVELLTGRAAVEAARTGETLVLVVPEGLARAAHGLIAAEHAAPGGSVLYGHQGLWRVETCLASSGGPSSLYLPAGRHTLLARPDAPPAPPRRFDPATQLLGFTENWSQDRAPPPEPSDPDAEREDLALRQLSQDQAPPAAPPPEPGRKQEEADAAAAASTRPALTTRDRQKWLRLRVLSSRSPSLRRHYLDFRKAYADDRSKPLPPGEADRPWGHTQGASQAVRDEQEAGIVARDLQNLRRREIRHHQEDLARKDMAHLEGERFLREQREDLFAGEPLKYQTRALLAPTRARVDLVLGQAAALDVQIRGLIGTPGFEATVASLTAQRNALLLEADRRRDQLEELIELH